MEAVGVTAGGPADIVLADGTPLFVDGGPPDPPPLASGPGVVHRWGAEAGVLRPATHRPPSAELAPDQLAAVGHRSGAARVIAPAGSGKTRVLTERLRHLVSDRGTPPGTVSALAYNTRAADEMKQRCSGVLTPDGPHIRTLNSTGLWICSEFGGGRPRVLEELDVRDVLQSQFEIRRQANTDTVAPYIAALSAIRLGLSSPESVEEAVPRRVGHRRGLRPLPPCVGRPRSRRLRRADLPGHRDPPHRPRRPRRRPGPMPPAARRRVPGPHSGPPADDPAARRAGLRLLRGRRRRPGHLRLLGGDPRVPHRLPALLPGRRPPSTRGQLPVPALDRGRGEQRPLLQPPPAGEDHPLAGGSPGRPAGPRRPVGRSRPGGRARRGRRCHGRAGGGDHLRVAPTRGRPR